MLKLTGQDFGQQEVAIKIKIKNKGKNQTKGDDVKFLIVLKFEGAEKALLEKEVTLKPSKTKGGNSFTGTITVQIQKHSEIEWTYNKMNVEVSGEGLGRLSKDIKIQKTEK